MSTSRRQHRGAFRGEFVRAAGSARTIAVEAPESRLGLFVIVLFVITPFALILFFVHVAHGSDPTTACAPLSGFAADLTDGERFALRFVYERADVLISAADIKTKSAEFLLYLQRK